MILKHVIHNPDRIKLNGIAKEAFDNIKNKKMAKDLPTVPPVISLSFPDKTFIKANWYKIEDDIHYYKITIK